MNDEREIRFIYSEKIDEKVFNRILELMKELIISIQEEKMNKDPDFRNVHIPKDLFSLSIFHCSLHQILLVVDCHFIEYVFLR